MNAMEPKPGRVWPWFAAFLIAMAVAIAIVLGDRTIAKSTAFGIVLAPLLLLAPMLRNALRHLGARGSAGQAQRRYLIRMALVGLAYLGAVCLASSLIDKGDPVTPLSAAIALLPGLAVLGFFWSIARLIGEQQDEFMRMLIVRQAMVATGFSLSIASVWGFLEEFGQVPFVPSYWVAVLWFLGLGLGGLVNKVRYGTTGDCA